MTEHDERIARMRAEMDQAKEAAGELAATMYAYFKGLTDAGFTDAQAMELTSGYQFALISANPGSDGEDN